MKRDKRLIQLEGNCKVQGYYDEKWKMEVCKKTITSNNPKQFNRFVVEVQALAVASRKSDCIDYLYSKCKILPISKFQLSIYTQLCDEGNLSQVLARRIEEQNYYTSKDIFHFLTNFINLLSSLQEAGISHRDIKPENIFVHKGALKLGDFGSSLLKNPNFENEQSLSLVGSPLFLSPELRKLLSQSTLLYSPLRGNYDPFRSDVYSLGLVFLSLTLLRPIDQRFCDLESLEPTLFDWLSKVQDSKIKSILTQMLTINPESRLDFLGLREILNSLKGFSAELSTSAWLGNGTISTIPSSNSSINVGKLDEDKTGASQLANGLKMASFSQSYALVLPGSYPCSSCRVQMTLSASRTHYVCYPCQKEYCSICKQSQHTPATCVESLQPFVYTCKCGLACPKYFCGDIFFSCSKCVFRCLVCLSGYTRSHTACAAYFGRSILSNL
jgi:serine/threonine protein kinase